MDERVDERVNAVRLDERDGRVRVTGDLDVAGGALLDRTLLELEDRGTVIELDLAEVTFVDSTGLRSLLAASRRASIDGRRVGIVNASTVVRRLLDITATSDLVDMVTEP